MPAPGRPARRGLVLEGGGLFVDNGFAGADPGHRGGVNVAAGDLDGDGRAEIVTAHASDGQPTVRTFHYNLLTDTATPYRSAFNAYAAGFTGGVTVAAGNLYNDGTAEIVTGPAGQGGPHIKIFNGDGSNINPGIFAYAADYFGGVNVAIGDLTGDSRSEVVTGAGPGAARTSGPSTVSSRRSARSASGPTPSPSPAAPSSALVGPEPPPGQARASASALRRL